LFNMTPEMEKKKKKKKTNVVEKKKSSEYKKDKTPLDVIQCGVKATGHEEAQGLKGVDAA